MAEQCPRVAGGAAAGEGLVGGGKKPLETAEAGALVVKALCRITKLLQERDNGDGFVNDYLLTRAVVDATRAFSAFEARAHPDLVRSVWVAFVRSDARLASLFQNKLPKDTQTNVMKLAAGKSGQGRANG